MKDRFIFYEGIWMPVSKLPTGLLFDILKQPITIRQDDSPNTDMTREDFNERVRIEILAREMVYV